MSKEAIQQIIDMLNRRMDMNLRPHRLSDFYPETNTAPGLYTGMSEADFQKRRAIMLAQMAELAHQETVDSAELSNGDQL